MMRLFAGVLAAAVLTPVSIAAAVTVTGTKDTSCWDEYNVRGTRRYGTIVASGISPTECTPGAGCYYGYDAAGKRSRLYVPHAAPPSKCTGAVTVVTTTLAPTTTATPTTIATTTATTLAPTTVATTTATTLAPTTVATTTATTTATTLAPTTVATTLAPTTVATTVPTAPPTAGAQFVETFDTTASLNRFQWVLSDGRDFFTQQGVSWNSDHDVNCGSPATTRPQSGPNDGQPYHIPMVFNPVQTGQVYWCNGHAMSTFHTHGYAHLDFAPAQSFARVREVCFDINATDLGHRKWSQVAVVPEAEFQAHGQSLLYVHPGFGGPGGPAESWALPIANGTFLASFNNGGIETFGSASGTAAPIFTGNTDKVTRLTTCISDSGSGVVITQKRPDGSVRTTNVGGALPAGQARVVFMDVSYNPDKAAIEGAGAQVVDPYTRHWDNIIIR